MRLVGAVLDPAQPGRQVGDQMMAEGTHFRGFSGAIQPSKGNSGLSQMAHFYQQAAADDQTGRGKFLSFDVGRLEVHCVAISLA